MRDGKDGGPSRVLRCKTRLGTALVGVKSVDFAPVFISFLSSFAPFGGQRHANIGPGPSEPPANVFFKMSTAR